MFEETATLDAQESVEHARLEAAQTRLSQALATLDARIEPLLKQAHAAAKLKEENAALKAEREELKKQLHATQAKNEKLQGEIRHVSSRLDAAIEKIGRVLEG